MPESCSIDGCKRALVARGWCGMHYRRWQKHGDPAYLAPRPPIPPPDDRFWSKVEKTEGCWLWQAKRDHDGYGRFWLDGKTRGAHVVAWLLTRGPVTDGLCVLHRCDNPRCVNPSHLFLGTFADNNVDRAAKGRSAKVKPNQRGRRKPPRTCSVVDCEEPFLARGFCGVHYRIWRAQRTDVRACSITGCAEPFVARNWCHKHYKRWQTWGDPLIARAP